MKKTDLLSLFISYLPVLIALTGITVFCVGIYTISTTVGLIVTGILLVIIAFIVEGNLAERDNK